ncbi:hypothetical protein PIECOFPK_01180 [Mycovorax composti]|jgi:hypothetical protein|uniref:Uncharacterized protein n=2 Tax=Chitinophagaceae TaxID=563835 RepID=A0ABZ2EIV1_9BACT
MRNALTNNQAMLTVIDGESAYPKELPIKFTADAIKYLSSVTTSINLKDWRWHEEEINGQKYYIITDKITSAAES